jgi:hypothetical protein
MKWERVYEAAACVVVACVVAGVAVVFFYAVASAALDGLR